MSLTLYLRLTLAFMVFDAVVFGLLYSMQAATSLTPAFLAIRALVDVTFILTNLERLSLKPRDGFLLFWLICAAIAGGVMVASGVGGYSASRVLSDVALPIIFILKVVLIVRMLSGQINFPAEVRLMVGLLIIASILQVATFLTVGTMFGAYAGIAVPVTLPLADALARNGMPVLVLCFVLFLASGKRAFLLSALFASMLAVFGPGSRLVTRLAGIAAIPVMLVVGIILAPLLESTISKFEAAFSIFDSFSSVGAFGLDVVMNETVRSGLYAATAGRSEEFYGIIELMAPINYIIGKGAGFTYDYLHYDGLVKGYANSHFSPLSLTYKFGIVFCCAFYIYTFKNIWWLLKGGNNFNRTIGFALAMFFIQSFFSFNLFAEPLIPILVAAAAFVRGERYGQEGAGRPIKPPPGALMPVRID